MTRQPSQRELFVSERPVRSDYGRERSYARRRVRTLAVVALVIVGLGYALWGHGSSNPADIPTIKAEGAYKDKPANPGGIDIPHQDVRVYDELNGKGGVAEASPQVEHLLPPSEMPKEAPYVVVPVMPPAAAPPLVAAPATVAQAPEPVAAPIPAQNSPMANASLLPKDEIGGAAPAVKAVATTVAALPVAAEQPKPVVAPVQKTVPIPEPKNVSIAQIIQATKPAAPAAASVAVVVAPSPKASLAAGHVVVQLASTPDEARARSLVTDFQSKYASTMGGVALHVVRADLGARGIYYRIQSSSLAESEANRICSSLKKMNAGCILVRK